jgi:hypothetical protein
MRYRAGCEPRAAHRANPRPDPHRRHPDPTAPPTAHRSALESAAARAGAAGTDPPAHQPDHPCAGCTVRHQPISGRPHHPPPGPAAGQGAHTRHQQQRKRDMDHRRHAPCTTKRSPRRPRTTGAASTPRSSSAPTGAALSRSGAAGPATATTSWSPATPLHTSSTARLSWAMAAIAASTPSPHHGVTVRGRIIRDHHYRQHRRIRARVEHVIARLKDWQILRQCRRRGHPINHSLQIIAPDSGTSRPTNNYVSTIRK